MTGGCIVNREAKYRPARGQGWLDTCGYPRFAPMQYGVWVQSRGNTTDLGLQSRGKPTVRIGMDHVQDTVELIT